MKIKKAKAALVLYKCQETEDIEENMTSTCTLKKKKSLVCTEDVQLAVFRYKIQYHH